VDADTGKLLWTVPLKSPYGVNVATPVYGNSRIFYTTPYVYGACYDVRAHGNRTQRR
jgi:outer membrane protein assembly factor BamB